LEFFIFVSYVGDQPPQTETPP